MVAVMWKQVVVSCRHLRQQLVHNAQLSRLSACNYMTDAEVRTASDGECRSQSQRNLRSALLICSAVAGKRKRRRRCSGAAHAASPRRA
mmetsp:Transcript_8498/g.18935  ORF Transcript_8498/g.18935 Transcript_8498/m.18935 type:complete len:89 (+) Transcript_8498:249-515(+)